MIHTAEFHSRVFKRNTSESDSLSRLISDQRRQVDDLKPIRLYYQLLQDKEHGYYALHLDALLLLQKINVEDSDIAIIKAALNQFLKPAGFTIEDFLVARVDYCHNTVMEPILRHCLFETLQSAPMIGPYVHRKGAYFMGVMWCNKSREILVYDKETERSNKDKEILPYEQNIIRIEHQIKLSHIKNKRKKRVSRQFDIWINRKMCDKYFLQASKLLSTADFWSLSKSIELIKQSAYSPAMQNKLIDFIMTICLNGAYVKQKELSINTFKKYIELLNEINVNYLAIKDYWTVEHIKNPFYRLNKGNS